MQVADAQVAQARGGVRQAGLGPNPRIYLQSEDLRPWADEFSFANSTEDYGYFGQTFEVAGKRGKRVAFASARLHQAEATRAVQVRQITGAVAVAYWNAVSLDRIVALLRDDMRVVDEMVSYHQKRVDAGAMRGVDLLRMQIERDRLQITLDTTERDAAQARLELFRQMGRPAADVQLSGRVEDVPLIAAPEVATVLQQRADVQAARDAVAAAEADLRLQKANGVPDPDLLGGYKRNGAFNTLYGSLQIQLPFRNRNQGEVERARASVGGAQAGLALVESQVRIEIEEAQKSFEAQQRIVQQTLPEMRERAKQNLQIAGEAYRLGGVDLLRFIDAERTEFEVEMSAVRTLTQLQQSAVRLQMVYGVQP